jgi:Secretion system C-terminal sorting domain
MKVLSWHLSTIILSLWLLSTNIALAQWEQVIVPDSIDPSMLVIHNDSIFLGTNKGLYFSGDNCNSWEYLGLENYGISTVLLTSDKQLFVGGSGNIFKYRGNNTWSNVYQHYNNIICFMEISPGKLLFGTWNGICRSADGGENWDMVLELYCWEKINDFTQNSEGTLFAGSNSFVMQTSPGGIYRSTDEGLSWKLISLKKTEINALTTNSMDEIYAGARIGLFKSLDDNGQSWEEIIDDNNIVSICINPLDMVVIGCTNYDSDEGGIFQSCDNGQNWTNISPAICGKSFAQVVLTEQDQLYALAYWLAPGLFRTINPLTKLKPIKISANELSIFPNPASQSLTIQLPDEEEYQIKIKDLSGKTVLEYKNIMPVQKQLSLNISILKPGVYLIHVYNKKNCYQQKFIKI